MNCSHNLLSILLISVFCISGSAEEKSKDTPMNPGPWVTSIAQHPQSEDIWVSTASSLPLRPSTIQRSSWTASDKLDVWGELPGSVWKVVLIDDGKRLVASDYSGNLFVGEVANSASMKKVEPKQRWIRAMHVLNDGKVLVGTEDGKMLPLNPSDATLGTAIEAHKSAIFSIAANSDQTRLITTSGEGNVKVWKAPDLSQELDIAVGSSAVWSACFDSSGKHIVTADAGRRVNLYASDSGKIMMTIALLPDWGTSTALLASDAVAVGCLDGNVYIVDLQSKKIAAKLKGPGSGIWTIALHRDGKKIMAGTRSKGLCTFDDSQWLSGLEETRRLASLEQPPAP